MGTAVGLLDEMTGCPEGDWIDGFAPVAEGMLGLPELEADETMGLLELEVDGLQSAYKQSDGCGAPVADGTTDGMALLLELAPCDGLGLAPDFPSLLNTFRLLMDQYESANALGLFWTKSWQVFALAEQVGSELQTLPAQSPQKVVSKTICWSLNMLSILHDDEPKLASGRPQDEGSGDELMFDGTDLRGKYQTLIPFEVHSVAYTPPFPLLNPSP